MTAQAALRDALREVVAPRAREHGYKGSAPTWRKSNPLGDYAIVNVQSSTFSSAQQLRCVINISVAPEPWLRWNAHQLGAGMPKQVKESLGLFRDRIHPADSPTSREGWWDVTDGSSAMRAATDMVAQLDTGTWDQLDQMLSREGIRNRIHQGDLGVWKREYLGGLFIHAEALLLMDEGPSDALDRLLQQATEGITPEQRPQAEAFDHWVRDQAARAKHNQN